MNTAGRVAAVLCAVGLAALSGPVPALGQPQDQVRLRLTVGLPQPRVITAATGTLTVTGRITNTGDRRIDDLRVRVQRGAPETTEQQMRDALRHGQPTDAGGFEFTPVTRSLQPGQSAELTVAVPVHGDGDRSLGIDQPGVYPLLVNVNGTPEFGGAARLATSGLLLPVLAVPGGPAARSKPGPARIGVLWPLTDDHPRVVRSDGGTVVLADDGLAASLGRGGRLDGLLAAAEAAEGDEPAVKSALCFAVDPDLVATADAMAGGYLVLGRDGHTRQGTGASVADTWLDRLRSLVQGGQCVLTLPYADADLVTLSRTGAVDLQQLALGGASVLQRILHIDAPRQGVVWPDRGTLDQRTVSDLSAGGPLTVLADPAKVQRPTGSAPWTLLGSSTTTVLPYDGLLATALAVPGSVQDALAALTYRALYDGAQNESVLITPPRRWALPRGELTAFLDQLGTLLDGSAATPVSPAALVAEPGRGTAAGLDYAAADAAAEIPESVTDELIRLNATQRDLVNAMQEDPAAKVVPSSLIQPLQYGLVRATSTAFRGHPSQARAAVGVVRGQLDSLISKVSVYVPGPPISLGSKDAPLPVTVVNQLPVAVLVQIRFSKVPGLQPAAVPVRRVPPNNNLPVFADSKVLRSGRFTVDVSLETPSGATRLGTARLELRSTSYGTITVVLTGIAGGALVLLSGRRIFRRIRAGRAARATAALPPEHPQAG